MYFSAVASGESPFAPTVFIVDDDPDVRKSIALLVRSVGLPSTTFESASEFIEQFDARWRGCLITDLRMPDISGLELQCALKAKRTTLPIIFISAHANIADASMALRAGAIDFLAKPFNSNLLIERVWEAIEIGRKRADANERHKTVRNRLSTLTNREREVMELLIEGVSSKQVALKLQLSVKTVDNHRAKILTKMQVDNTTQLTRMVA